MIGTELKQPGSVFVSEEVLVNHLIMPNEGKIAKHHHPGYNIFFTVTKGKMQIFMNETEEHILEPGNALHFDGDNYISGNALADSDIFIYLVKKNG